MQGRDCYSLWVSLCWNQQKTGLEAVERRQIKDSHKSKLLVRKVCWHFWFHLHRGPCNNLSWQEQLRSCIKMTLKQVEHLYSPPSDYCKNHAKQTWCSFESRRKLEKISTGFIIERLEKIQFIIISNYLGAQLTFWVPKEMYLFKLAMFLELLNEMQS